MRRSVVLAMVGVSLGVAVLAPPAPAVASGPVSHEAILRAFNAERTAAGLPPVTENPEWSAACAAHNTWMSANHRLSHAETPGTPAYTEAGNWAGTHAVLAGQGTSWASGDPWATAPIHLSQLMDPLLSTVGVDETDGYDCLTTWPGYVAPTADPATTAWFPGQGATLPYAETAAESPTTPGAWVGLPEGTQTGPYLYLYTPGRSGDADYSDNSCSPAPGGGCRPGTQTDPTPTVLPLATVTGVRLIGPGGPVDVRTVDREVAERAGYGGYLPTAAVFIPAQPLQPSSSYTLTATLSSAAPPPEAGTANEVYTATGPVTTSYSFRTTASPPPPPAVTVKPGGGVGLPPTNGPAAGSPTATGTARGRTTTSPPTSRVRAGTATVLVPTRLRHGAPVTVDVTLARRSTVAVVVTGARGRVLGRVAYSLAASRKGWSYPLRLGLPRAGTRAGMRVTVTVTVSAPGAGAARVSRTVSYTA